MAEPHESAATHAGTEALGAAEHHAPSVLGIEAAGFVSLSMLLVIALLLWKKVPAAIGRGLDGRISAIRAQLAEAEALRTEAQALKAEYQAKYDTAETEAAAMIDRANRDAEGIVAKARTDAETLVARRTRMAEDKIAAEERAAVDQVRASVASAAARASARLIAERHDAASDARLVDGTIAGLGLR
jgi:F-type H+-transporting ATPase subunit b